MSFHIEYLKIVITDDIPNLPKTIRHTIQQAISERLTTDPLGLGKPLRNSLKGHYRIRVSHYRIVYRVENKSTVLITRIRHRNDAYN